MNGFYTPIVMRIQERRVAGAGLSETREAPVIAVMAFPGVSLLRRSNPGHPFPAPNFEQP